MPILRVEVVGDPAADRAGLASRLAAAAGDVLASPPQGTWVRVSVLPAGDYAENGGGPPGDLPVFVHVTKRSLGGGIEGEARALAEAIGRVCERDPDRVHVIYEPAGAGRVAFGGRLVPPG